jgi:peptidoglycan/LPS O-acetylase OafA/YrhL
MADQREAHAGAQVMAEEATVRGGAMERALVGHRSDIDGLRAIAVLPVLLFHADFALFSGGFVGVDIFFVISGYLITQVIAKDFARGQFSLGRFYERRIRRILPALFLIISASFLVAAIVLLPIDFRDFAKTVVGAVTSTSNILFWMDSARYFNAPAHYKPLLHTWSLSVEEQFYLFYPIALFVVLRFADRRKGALIALAFLSSLVISVWSAEHIPTSGFYLLPARAWELLVGGAIALGIVRPPASAWAREALSWSGLAAVVASVFSFSPGMAFPGYLALLPCLGAGALILANTAGQTNCGRLLSARPLVAIGLISYSLYLWHWPVFVFARLASPYHIGALGHLALILIAIGLSVLSWRFVEQPFRLAAARRGTVFAVAGVGALLLCLAAIAVIRCDGWRWRFSPQIVRLSEYSAYDETPAWRSGVRQGTCFITLGETSGYDPGQCFAPRAGKHNVLLWGDSLAAHYMPALGLEVARVDGYLMQATKGGCPPLSDIDYPNVRGCSDFNRRIWSLIDNNRVDGVILAADWFNAIHVSDETVFRKLNETINALAKRGIPVLVLGPPPEFSERLSLLLARYRIANDNPALHPDHFLREDLTENGKRLAHAVGTRVRYVDVVGSVCPNLRCPTMVGDVPVIFDTHHLTREGAGLAVGAMRGPIDDFVRSTRLTPEAGTGQNRSLGTP